MANYDPATARAILLFTRRKVTDSLSQNFGGFVLELLPYYKVTFNIDTPGEAQWFYEPFSEREGTTWAGDVNVTNPTAYPIVGFEFVENPPAVPTFGVGAF